jgi:hypothetical protein
MPWRAVPRVVAVVRFWQVVQHEPGHATNLLAVASPARPHQALAQRPGPRPGRSRLHDFAYLTVARELSGQSDLSTLAEWDEWYRAARPKPIFLGRRRLASVVDRVPGQGDRISSRGRRPSERTLLRPSSVGGCDLGCKDRSAAHWLRRYDRYPCTFSAVRSSLGRCDSVMRSSRRKGLA